MDVLFDTNFFGWVVGICIGVNIFMFVGGKCLIHFETRKLIDLYCDAVRSVLKSSPCITLTGANPPVEQSTGYWRDFKITLWRDDSVVPTSTYVISCGGCHYKLDLVEGQWCRLQIKNGDDGYVIIFKKGGKIKSIKKQ